MQMTIAELQSFMAREFPQMAPLNMQVEAFDGHMLRLSLPVSEAQLRPGGTVSGPTMMTLADCAAYLLLLGQIGPVALAVTTNLNINFLRKPEPKRMTAEARMLKRGKTLAIMEIGIYSEGVEEGPVAHATLTYAIPPARK
ncbi:PaaI family thioesterase [Ferrovibrio sp.]|uniref:PaaI family thioesterase n=1 Tax=Ferrovibrio sp. TaxID=1917215 RepID=UPI003D0DA80B